LFDLASCAGGAGRCGEAVSAGGRLSGGEAKKKRKNTESKKASSSVAVVGRRRFFDFASCALVGNNRAEDVGFHVGFFSLRPESRSLEKQKGK
jgi:hypothetical protein